MIGDICARKFFFAFFTPFIHRFFTLGSGIPPTATADDLGATCRCFSG
jgi:hypothetical protein